MNGVRITKRQCCDCDLGNDGSLENVYQQCLLSNLSPTIEGIYSDRKHGAILSQSLLHDHRVIRLRS